MRGKRVNRRRSERSIACRRIIGYHPHGSSHCNLLTGPAEMMASSPERLTYRIAGAFCLLLFGGPIAPSTAWAGCGHTVTSILSRSNHESLSGLELLSPFNAQTDDSASESPQRKLPCTGPFCSSEERGSPRAPSSLSSPRSEAWCCRVIAHGSTDQNGDYRSSDFVAVHARHRTFPIERPPRTSRLHTFS
jgi:hypothetical protein